MSNIKILNGTMKKQFTYKINKSELKIDKL